MANNLSLYKPCVVDIINETVQAYAEKYTTDPDSLLQELGRLTDAHPHGHMGSGKVQGQLLALISSLVQPKRILEVGTFTGYSALCLAKGLAPGGQLHTIELSEREAETAKGYFARSPWHNQIILHLGNALDVIPALRETWDLVFIDADKTHYVDYYKLALTNVRQSGVIIADNVLFHGEVLQPEIKGKNARAIQDFNDYVQRDMAVEKIFLTVRDGLMIMRKK